MIPAYSFEQIERELSYQSQQYKKTRIAGLLFARPGSSIAQTEIIPDLEYFHYRSGNDVHFFCGGYSAYKDIYDDNLPVIKINGIQWYFSANKFNELRKQIENSTIWKYSGGVDLLLQNVKNSAETATLDLKSTVLFPLEKMKRDGVIVSVSGFFEEIFRFAEEYLGGNAVEEFIDPPDVGNIKLAPSNIGILFGRMTDCWNRNDYGGVLHSSASIFETMAKDVVRNPAVENQTLGSFFEQYRKHSTLPKPSLDLILDTYKWRNSTPLAGHGSTTTPQISREQAKEIISITGDFVRHEYKERAMKVGI
ncbi:MAG: hypothetical protein KDE56_00595 [Anaerolineales bacterium]|nr:hypothetical protein [Anaerolineales bacterium]